MHGFPSFRMSAAVDDCPQGGHVDTMVLDRITEVRMLFKNATVAPSEDGTQAFSFDDDRRVSIKTKNTTKVSVQRRGVFDNPVQPLC